MSSRATHISPSTYKDHTNHTGHSNLCVCVSMCTYVPVCIIGRENHYTVSGGGDQHDSLIASLHIYNYKGRGKGNLTVIVYK